MGVPRAGDGGVRSGRHRLRKCPAVGAAVAAEDRVFFGLRGAVRDTTLARTPA
ncbi:hypothetical protein OG410_38400 [Streptomyces sp. NBC_00659]|uniref:hypothetical protein n=1 Tax=Streptomyces sp. NBC_00659 TaxID=2903669 RepID=UPI002E379D93|nr:hypothetical protein [Streptomyces sp. NBC_00659]